MLQRTYYSRKEDSNCHQRSYPRLQASRVFRSTDHLVQNAQTVLVHGVATVGLRLTLTMHIPHYFRRKVAVSN
jgi:predicted naringenin-chalcone synthase